MEGSSRRILLIDDSPVALKALKTTLGLRNEWQIVGEAENGRKGITLFHEQHPDVVIVDFQMPGMNDIEVGKEIRRTSTGVLLILFTLHTGPEIDTLAKDAGFDAVLSKAAVFPIVPIIEKMRSFSPAGTTKDTQP